MSMYAEYLMEKTNDHILETQRGFATYRYVDDKKAVYIIDIYVLPEFRKTGEAGLMADAICKDAKDLGYTKLLGSVVPSSKNSTDSLRVLLGYGMVLDSSTNDFILFKKDI